MVKVSAGSYDLNRWLAGGYESDVITTIYGGPGTGKTNFCMIVVASQAKKARKFCMLIPREDFQLKDLSSS